MRVSGFLLSMFVCAIAASCVAQAPTDRAGDLRAFLQEEWQYWMAQYPETATAVGTPGVHERWTDYSPAAIDARKQALTTGLNKLRSFDRATLSADDQLNHDLYREMLESAVRGLELGNDALPIRGVIPHNLLMPMNQLEGMQQDLPRTIALMPAATVADYDAIVRRLDAAPALIDQTIALMRQGIGAGRDAAAHDVPRGARTGRRTDRRRPEGEPAARGVLARFRPSIAPADRDRLTQAAVGAYMTRSSPRSSGCTTFLVDDVRAGVPDDDRRDRAAERRRALRLQRPVAHDDSSGRRRRSTTSARPR